MRTIVEETKEYIVYHHTGMTRFTGCECYKDCTCSNDFIPAPYNYYTVKKKFGRHHTTHHNSLDEVKERLIVLMNVPNKRYHDIKT